MWRPLERSETRTFAGASKTGENDNWGGAPQPSSTHHRRRRFAYLNATPRSTPPFVDHDHLAGDNSVKVSGTGNGTGAVIAELYDSTPATAFTATTPRLVNVSVLKQLGTGLTAGFVVGGTTPEKLLIRAVGPSLGAAPFNVAGAIADPQLTLFSGQTNIGSNDNWGGTAALVNTFTQVGAFAFSSGHVPRRRAARHPPARHVHRPGQRSRRHHRRRHRRDLRGALKSEESVAREPRE